MKTTHAITIVAAVAIVGGAAWYSYQATAERRRAELTAQQMASATRPPERDNTIANILGAASSAIFTAFGAAL